MSVVLGKGADGLSWEGGLSAGCVPMPSYRPKPSSHPKNPAAAPHRPLPAL